MRIQHNIAAMNSYRQMGGNNNALSKNLEKLSSGYRINRAGDDAAGLAISEKMRAQIKGLETAQKNANDGISLVQTAEGALTEVHSMLNRMTELATQSANGTYDNDVDRRNLQKEVVALKDEIDRISKSTNFNGINLLDGSLGMNTEAFTNITSTSAVTAAVTTADELGITNIQKTEAGIPSGSAQKLKFEVDLSNLVVDAKDSTFEVQIGDLVLENTTAQAVGKTGKDIVGGLTFKSNTSGGTALNKVTFNGIEDAAGNAIEFTATCGADGKIVFEMNANPAKGDKIELPNLTVTVTESSGTGAFSGQYLKEAQVTQQAIIPTDTQLAEAEFTIDFDKLTDGSKLKVGDQTLVFKFDKNATVAGANVDLSDASRYGIDASDGFSTEEKEKIAQEIVNQLGANTQWRVELKDAAAGKIGLLELQANATNAAAGTAGAVDFSKIDNIKDSVRLETPNNVASSSVKIDKSKLAAHDTISINGQVYEFVGKATDKVAGNNIQVVVEGLSEKAGTATGDAAKALAGKVTGATAKDGVVTVKAATMDEKAPVIESSGVKLQVGDTADEFNKVNVKVGSMNTRALGIDGIDISTQTGASDAISKIKDAINHVSSTRGDLGAVQNRLEHTINNLGVTTENITAAESRIRDTDMASEMMAYTKNNILIQASQAMLAQANQVPQGVLQLLQ